MSLDRIGKSMENWYKQEDELKQQFRDEHFANNRHVQEEKLKHMESLRDTYKYQELSPTEKSTLRILKGQIKDLEKRLYPNLVKRLTKRLVRTVDKYNEVRRANFQGVNPGQNIKTEPSTNGVESLENQQNQLQIKDSNEQPLTNQKSDQRIANEYHKRLLQKNRLQPLGKKIKHRLR